MTQLIGPESFSEIPRIAECDADTFREKYLGPGVPVILAGYGKSWPAYGKWSFDYFLNNAFDAVLPAKVGDHVREDQQCIAVPFKDYLRGILQDPQRLDPRSPYVTNVDLFRLFPELKGDVDLSLLNGNKLWTYQRTHFGPAHVGAGYHFDLADNLLAQMWGSKRLRLISPQHSARMYPKGRYKFFTTISEVEPREFDAERFPAFVGIPASVGVLEPGDVAFMPKGWWHHLEALTPSITFTNWGMNLRDIVEDGVPEFTKKIAHELGLYRRGNCSCHRFELTRKLQF